MHKLLKNTFHIVTCFKKQKQQGTGVVENKLMNVLYAII